MAKVVYIVKKFKPLSKCECHITLLQEESL